MTRATESRQPETAGAADFVEEVHRSFLTACQRAGRVETHYQVAGIPFTLALAGNALGAALTPALIHLRTLHAGGDLLVCAWDTHSTGVIPPPPAWSRVDYYGNSEVRGFADGRICAAFDVSLGMLSLYDVERRLAFVWLRESRRIPIAVVGTPLRIVLQWWADQHDRVLIHAAAVGTPTSGLVIAGPSGAGKSTTALIALSRGFSYAGDDFVLVQPEPAPRVHALYSSAKIHADTLTAWCPSLDAAIGPAGGGPDEEDEEDEEDEKQVLFVHRSWPDRVAPSLPIRAVLLPAITGSSTSRVVSVGSGDALRALVPGVLPFPGMRRFAVGRLARLARKVPAYRLELGRDPAGIADVLLEVCERHES